MRDQLEEHYGKLWVLGMGLVFSQEIYLWLFGTEIAEDGLHATALLVGIIALSLSMYGSRRSARSESL